MKKNLLLTVIFTSIFAISAFAQQLARNVDRKNFTSSDFNADNVKLKWQFQTKGQVFSSPIVADGILYIGSCDSNLYALDSNNGKLLWSYKTKGEIRASVAVDKDQVYFPSSDGNLYALECKTGKLKWIYKTAGENVYDIWDYFQSSPAVIDGVVYFGSGDQHVYALYAKTGELQWRFKTGGIVHAAPTISDNAILIGSFDGHFYCLEKDGSLRWQFNTIGEHYFPKGEVQYHAVVSDSTVYFGARDYNLYALKIKDGTGHWVYHQPGSWVSIPSVSEGQVLATMSDSYSILTLDKVYGNLVRSSFVPINVFSSASISDSVAYFGAIDGILYQFNISTGVVEPIYQTQSSKVHRSEFFGSDGKLRSDLYELYHNDVNKVFNAYYKMGSIFSTVWIAKSSIYFASTDGCVYALE